MLGAAQGPAAPAESLSLPINHSAAVLTIIMFKCLVLQQSGGCGIVFASALRAAVLESQPPVNNRVMSIKVQNVVCLWRRSDVLLREMRVGGPGPFLSVPHLTLAASRSKAKVERKIDVFWFTDIPADLTWTES